MGESGRNNTSNNGRTFGDNLDVQMKQKQHTNRAIRYKIGGQWKWIWYDFIGRDYGPYDTKWQAMVLGQHSSVREEKMLRKPIEG